MRNLGLVSVLLVLIYPLPSSSSQSCSVPVSFPSNRVFGTCNDLPTLSSSLRWSFDFANATLSFAFSAPPAAGAGEDGWVSWSINPTGEGMLGSQALIAYRQADGRMGVKTYNISGYAIKPSPIDFATADLAADFVDGVMRIYGKMFLARGMTVANQVWQVGAAVSNGNPAKHAFDAANMNSKGKLDLIGRRSIVTIDSTTKEHGILNAVSWGILLPIGATFARYLKVFKYADPAWFYLHVACQVLGYALGVAGWGTGLSLGSRTKGVWYTGHRNIGISLFAIGTLQVFALLLRPNKDHKLRFYWNVYHHSVGYCVIVLGIVNVFKGLSIMKPGNQWKLAYIIFLCCLGAVALVLEAFTWALVLRRKPEKPTKLGDVSGPANP